MIIFIAAILFGNYLMTSFGVILGPAVNADIRDYQQYITGERIDGMFATVGLIGTVITMGTSGIVPAVYEKLGINETVLAQHADEIMSITGKSMELTKTPTTADLQSRISTLKNFSHRQKIISITKISRLCITKQKYATTRRFA